MKQNTHQKPIACLQAFLSVALVIAALVFCIVSPLYSIRLSNNNTETGEAETVDLAVYPTARALTRTIILLAKSERSSSGALLPTESLGEEDAKIVIGLQAVASEFLGSEPFSGYSEWHESVFSYETIALIALSVAALLLLVIPLTCLACSIGCFILFIQTFSNPGKVKKMAANISTIFPFTLAYVGLQALFPQFQLGSGGFWILILGAACIFLPTLATRFNSYTRAENRYLNLLQGGAVVGSLGFALFAFGLIKGGLISTYFQANGRYAAYSLAASLSSDKSISTLVGGIYVDIVLLILFSFFMFLAFFGYPMRCACRLVLARRQFRSLPQNTIAHSDENSIALAATLLFTAIIPFALLIPWHSSSLEAGRFAMVEFSKEQIIYFALAIGGALLMLATEIAISCLMAKSHTELGNAGIFAIWEGTPAVNTSGSDDAPVESEFSNAVEEENNP